MRHIIVSTQEKIAKALAIQIETKLNVETLIRANLDQARGMLEILPDVEKFILLHPVSEKEMNFFLSKIDTSTIDLIIPEGQEYEGEPTVRKWSEDVDVFSLLEDQGEMSEDDYIKFSIAHLDILDTSPVDYFIMIGEKRKFLKVINRDETDYAEALTRLHDRKIENVYIQKEDVSAVLKSISNVFIKESDKLKPVDVIKIQEEVYTIMQNVGISEASLKVASDYIEDTKERLSSNKDTKKLLNAVYLTSSNVSYQLTYMTALICSKVISSFSWSNSEMKNALINCAFFNDMNLDSSLTLIRSEVELKGIDKDQRMDILEHALKAANGLMSSTNVSALESSCKTILEHHGDPSGIGFGTDLDRLTKLSGIFIICEEFCCEIIKSEKGKVEIGKILSALKSKYSGKSVDQTCQSILEIFKGQ